MGKSILFFKFIRPKNKLNLKYSIVGFYDVIYPKMKWDSSLDYKNILKDFDIMKKNFVDKGYPVIIGEVGILNDYIKKNILFH